MRGGFTLLEVILSLGVIAILLGASLPLSQTFQTTSDLEDARFAHLRAIRRSQILALSGERDGPWGTYAATGTITVFKGQSYALRDQNFDEITSIAPSISVTGNVEFVFSTVTGVPGNTGTTTFGSFLGETKTVSVNTKGTAEY